MADGLLALVFVSAAAVSLATSWLLVSRLERIGSGVGLSEPPLGMLAALATIRFGVASREARASTARPNGFTITAAQPIEWLPVEELGGVPALGRPRAGYVTTMTAIVVL